GAFRSAAPADRAGRARQRHARRPGRGVGGGGAGLGESLGELLLRRAAAARSCALDACRRRGRLPRAGVLGGGRLMSLLARDRAALVVVDVQEGFRPYESFAGVAESCAKLLAAARILEVPALVSEQYPKGLGHSAPELGIEDERRIEKTVFSAARADGFDLGGREQAIVCGI